MRERGRIQGLTDFWGIPPVISGTEKAMDFKFRQYIRRVHPNNSRWKILDKREHGRIQELPDFFGYHRTTCYYRIRESYGYQISPVHSQGPSKQKPMKNFREKGAWAYPGTAHFFGYPLLSQGREKLRISASAFMGSIRAKREWEILGKRELGHIQWIPFFSCTFHSLDRNKSPLKFLEIIAMAVVRKTRTFSGHRYIGHIAPSSLQ